MSVQNVIDMGLTLGSSTTSDTTSLSGPTFEEIAGYAPVLLATARLLVRNDTEAHDLAQTTCEIGMRRLHTLRDPTKLLPWLLAIQTHEVFRLRRRLRRLVLVPAVSLADTSSPDGSEMLNVREALHKLPARARTAVVLHHMVGLSVQETAEAMGITTNTAKSHLKRGLELLREALQ